MTALETSSATTAVNGYAVLDRDILKDCARAERLDTATAPFCCAVFNKAVADEWSRSRQEPHSTTEAIETVPDGKVGDCESFGILAVENETLVIV